jgi:2-polyprenyl-3-methyl-5-hydroxy-6-metoxy-1,4-benzoquinol methylase
MVRFVPDNSRRILDLGCGEGSFGAVLKSLMNCEVWGVEIDDAAARIAEKKYDKVTCGDFLSLEKELPLKYFDCVIANDVIEHFADPAEVLSRIGQLLAPNGKLVFSIPNVRYFENLYELIIKKDWKYRSSGTLDFGHLRFYTKKSITDLFHENGFDLELISGVNRSFSRRLFKYLYLLINIVSLNAFEDTAYLQFAGVACPADRGSFSQESKAD